MRPTSFIITLPLDWKYSIGWDHVIACLIIVAGYGTYLLIFYNHRSPSSAGVGHVSRNVARPCNLRTLRLADGLAPTGSVPAYCLSAEARSALALPSEPSLRKPGSSTTSTVACPRSAWVRYGLRSLPRFRIGSMLHVAAPQSVSPSSAAGQGSFSRHRSLKF